MGKDLVHRKFRPPGKKKWGIVCKGEEWINSAINGYRASEATSRITCEYCSVSAMKQLIEDGDLVFTNPKLKFVGGTKFAVNERLDSITAVKLYFEGFSVREIASSFGVSESLVSKRINHLPSLLEDKEEVQRSLSNKQKLVNLELLKVSDQIRQISLLVEKLNTKGIDPILVSE